MQHKRELLACLMIAAIMTAIAATIAVLDPMGLDEAADRHSAAVIARILAPDYDGGSQSQDDRPTVVEITDSALARLEQPWPPPRSFYTDAIVTVARERPSAIFLDYTLVSEYRDAEERQRFFDMLGKITAVDRWPANGDCRTSPLAKLKCIVRAGGTPVILGKAFPPDQCGPGAGQALSQDIADQDAVVLLTPLGWTDLPELYRPLIGRDVYVDAMTKVYGPEITPPPTTPRDGVALLKACRYAQTQTHPAPGRPLWMGSAVYDLSPALALFAVQCLDDVVDREDGKPTRHPSMAPKARRLCAQLLADPANPAPRLSLPDEMVVAWGSLPLGRKLEFDKRLYQTDHQAEECREESLAPQRRLKVGLAQLGSALGDNVAATRVPCPYSPTFDYGILERALANANNLDIGRYFHGRAVLIGAALADSNDVVDDVVHGRQPGVHLHAMAYDNLLRYGAEQQRQPPDVFADSNPLSKLHIDWGEILELSCAFVVAFMIEVLRRRLDRGDLSRRQIYVRSAQVFILCGLLLVAAVALTQSLHWAPVNVVGLFGFIMLDGALNLWSIQGAMRLASFVVRALVRGVQRAGRLIVALWRLSRRRRRAPPSAEAPAAPSSPSLTSESVSKPDLETTP